MYINKNHHKEKSIRLLVSSLYPYTLAEGIMISVRSLRRSEEPHKVYIQGGR